MEVITKNAAETQKLGEKIGSSLKGGEVIALSGELGSGKTTFMQGLGKALGFDRIISPTFIIMRTYQRKMNLYHLDLYRLEKNADQELRNLGVEDYWGKPNNIVIIEWAEYAKDILPENTQWIRFEHVSDDERKITYTD